MAEEQQTTIEFKGELRGHSDWVTCIVSGFSQKENEDSAVLVSGSRDKTLIIWKLDEEGSQEDTKLFGKPYRQLTGHNHFVSDLALSQENCFVISSSWDQTLRLWDLRTGVTTRLFQGHTKEVFTVAFSPDNRQILSSGADRKILLWNTLGDIKYKTGPEHPQDQDTINHQDWVSQIRYAPKNQNSSKGYNIPPYFTSVGWDGRLKIWQTNMQVKASFKAHDGHIQAVSVAPNDGKYVATGGRDRKLNIWDVTDLSQPSRSFDSKSQINQIAFNPKLQWVAAATETGIRVWDLHSTQTNPSHNLKPEIPKVDGAKEPKLPICTSLSWNALGTRLFGGFSDGVIRVWEIKKN